MTWVLTTVLAATRLLSAPEATAVEAVVGFSVEKTQAFATDALWKSEAQVVVRALPSRLEVAVVVDGQVAASCVAGQSTAIEAVAFGSVAGRRGVVVIGRSSAGFERCVLSLHDANLTREADVEAALGDALAILPRPWTRPRLQAALDLAAGVRVDRRLALTDACPGTAARLKLEAWPLKLGSSKALARLGTELAAFDVPSRGSEVSLKLDVWSSGRFPFVLVSGKVDGTEVRRAGVVAAMGDGRACVLRVTPPPGNSLTVDWKPIVHATRGTLELATDDALSWWEFDDDGAREIFALTRRESDDTVGGGCWSRRSTSRWLELRGEAPRVVVVNSSTEESGSCAVLPTQARSAEQRDEVWAWDGVRYQPKAR
jgi:hypothetical protein